MSENKDTAVMNVNCAVSAKIRSRNEGMDKLPSIRSLIEDIAWKHDTETAIKEREQALFDKGETSFLFDAALESVWVFFFKGVGK